MNQLPDYELIETHVQIIYTYLNCLSDLIFSVYIPTRFIIQLLEWSWGR